MILVWVVSLSLGWEEKISVFQVLGFLTLIAGNMVYNKIVVFPKLFNYPALDEDDEEVLKTQALQRSLEATGRRSLRLHSLMNTPP